MELTRLDLSAEPFEPPAYRCDFCGEPRLASLADPHCGAESCAEAFARSLAGAQAREERERYPVAEKFRLPRKYTNASLGQAPEGMWSAYKLADQHVTGLHLGGFYGGGVVLAGPVGTGKTWLAAAIFNRAEALGGMCFWARGAGLAAAIKATWGDYRGEELLTEQLASVDLLVLDDFGIQAGDGGRMSDHVETMYFNIVDARSQADRPTVVTTNMESAELMTNRTKATIDRLKEGALALTLRTRQRGGVKTNERDSAEG